ncbi:NmrA family NAD(P)-binding protein [Maribacter sp. 2307ULW6-5]|uniref:NmrA family NAD(P)-binding protein n=1 Tax=Maribacter sp. 2307ULW6-5 TaxID=3386275 RepID=UPI0039BCEEC4
MQNILVTGATGNVGREVIRYLEKLPGNHSITAGVRDVAKAKKHWPHNRALQYAVFNFEDAATFKEALANVDTVFLLRPPHIASVNKVFGPLLRALSEKPGTGVVFLSVQGAEEHRFIPHHNIEALIRAREIPFVFLRPGYFMQNLTTTLLPGIIKTKTISLPAGKAKFNWVDVANIGEVAAHVLCRFQEHQGRAYDITVNELLDFQSVTDVMRQTLPYQVRYRNVNPLTFFWLKKKEGLPTMMILVMTMLHLLPRFQKVPRISRSYTDITGNTPTLLQQFLERERKTFLP